MVTSGGGGGLVADKQVGIDERVHHHLLLVESQLVLLGGLAGDQYVIYINKYKWYLFKNNINIKKDRFLYIY